MQFLLYSEIVNSVLLIFTLLPFRFNGLNRIMRKNRKYLQADQIVESLFTPAPGWLPGWKN